MLNIISVIIGKVIIKIGKPFGKSSSMPGFIVSKINKNIFKYFTLPKKIIAVTGSSGKGSTSRLIADILRDNNYIVAHNFNGSNLTDGILTLLLEYTKLNGTVDVDYIVYEIDERFTKEVFKLVKPTHVVITNITRDQPPRQGDYDIVSNIISEALNLGMHLILNGDDPYLRRFVSNKITYYGIEESSYSYKKNKFTNLNIEYCPLCNSKLEYNYYNIESLGDYHCPKCSFKRPKIDFLLTNFDFRSNVIYINGKALKVDSDILFYLYNVLAAYSLTSKLGMKDIEVSSISRKILNIYKVGDRKVVVLNNKNENASTFNQSIVYTNRFLEDKTVLIGWKEISRRYKHTDLSWLYDVQFELLDKDNIKKIICVGINRFDIALRLKLAGIEESKIVIRESLQDSIEDLKENSIYAIINFDYVRPFNKVMEGINYENNNTTSL